MTDAADRIPWDVHARLEDPTGVLAIKLAQWQARDESRAQPHVRRAASEAMTEIDRMLGELNLMRSRLVAKIRAADDATDVRADALLRGGGLPGEEE